jgi:RNA polymerase-binding transcription factor DksA
MSSDPGIPTSAAARDRLVAERDRLAGLRAGLEVGLTHETESGSSAELSDADQHPADVGTETFNRERDLGILENVTSELDDVDAALARLEAGTYGICEACGRPIGAERLDALPATHFCLEDAELAAAEAAPGVAPIGGRGDDLRAPGRPI